MASLVFTSTLGSLKCLAHGHYTASVGFEPWTSCSGVRRSTAESLRSPIDTGLTLTYFTARSNFVTGFSIGKNGHLAPESDALPLSHCAPLLTLD